MNPFKDPWTELNRASSDGFFLKISIRFREIRMPNFIKKFLMKRGFNKMKKEAMKIMPTLIAKLGGYKTYITALIGIVVAFLGVMWGPIHVGPIDIPAIPMNEFWKLVWEAFMIIFLRKGIASK